SCAASHGPATMSSASVPARSPTGPMPCPVSSRQGRGNAGAPRPRPPRGDAMSFPDITAELAAAMPGLRGTLVANAPLAPLTWFRTGGPAQVLFAPADEDDLALFLANLPERVPLTVIGLGSNLLVRDGGVPGVVLRLGKAFAEVSVEEGCRVRAGAGAPDVKVARAAAEAGIDGLTFLRGIPGAIGG